MTTDISTIDQQIADLQKRREELLASQRQEAVRQVKALIAQFGLSASEIGISQARASAPRTAAKIKVKAKYANPANPSQTWSGRGVSPKWVAEHVAKGGKKEDLLIR